MSNAKLDQNSRPSIICASKDDGTTIVPIIANPTTHEISVDDASTGTDNGNNGGAAMLDENGIPVWTALASDGSGTIVEVYADPATGKLLVDST